VDFYRIWEHQLSEQRSECAYDRSWSPAARCSRSGVPPARHDPLQALAKVRYWVVQFRESLRSTLRSATTRDRARHPYACTNLPSALELIMSISEQVVKSCRFREPTSR